MKIKDANRILTVIVLVVFLSACQKEVKKLPDHAANETEVTSAKTFVQNYFETMRNDTVYRLPDNISREMRQNITPGTLLEYYHEIITGYGDMQSIQFTEVWGSGKEDAMKILRFKGRFEKMDHPAEIRVHLKEDSIIHGFEIKPWKDNLYQ
ncbi:MAG: hypothetical protein GVY19_00750 [Bacteroidetes bacterium]|nr:hypothetical protein [Bacteroidota bacterium]